MAPQLVLHIRKFVPLSDTEAGLLMSFFQVVSLKKKALVLEEGKICSENYFVGKGCLRMYFIDDKGTEHTTHFALENWWLSDYTSLETGQPSGFYIQAVEASEVFVLKKEQEERLFETLPQLERYFRIIHRRAHAAWQYNIRYRYTYSREEQYHHFNGLFPEFVQRVPQYMLASYLGFTPEYLSEIRKKVKKG
jgi:CRP/FNR family transcriptional regulator, anaerobic regulatory protein